MVPGDVFKTGWRRQRSHCNDSLVRDVATDDNDSEGGDDEKESGKGEVDNAIAIGDKDGNRNKEEYQPPLLHWKETLEGD